MSTVQTGGYPEIRVQESKERTVRELLPLYTAFATHEWRLAPKTVRGYVEGINRILKVLGDVAPQEIDLQRVLMLKADLRAGEVGDCWTRQIINSLRSFLRFSRLVLNLNVVDPKTISMPRIPRREVIFLTPSEIEQFLAAVPVIDPETKRMNLRWLGFRCLMEVLVATGMRISEALSLKVTHINLDSGEAQVVGKGNKQRTVFFTARALGYVREFANKRNDPSEWLFVYPDGSRVTVNTVEQNCRKVCRWARLEKKVTPHILRHTCATTLLHNGCPIGFIKEVLGHDRLETTCRYYLGTDKRAAKEAHRKYLDF